MNKKVVILHPAHWEQAMGGAEIQISYLVNELVRENFDVYYIYEDNGTNILNSQKIHLFPLKKINIKNRFGKRWFLYYKRIKKTLNDIKPDCIYTRLYSSWSGIAAVYAKNNAIRHIWAIASDSDINRLSRNRSCLKPFDFIEDYFVKKAFKYATLILTQNSFQQEMLLSLHGRNGIKIPQMSLPERKNEIRKDCKIVNVIWVANIKPIKRPENFLELVKSNKNNKFVKFTMVGRCSSSYNLLLTQLADAQSNFYYLGELSNEEVNELLCQAHVLINTSEYEGFSNTFVQAWLRKVVVLSMRSNPDGVITHEKIGYMCKTVSELDMKLKFLQNNKDVLDEMAEKAYKYAINNHSVSNNISKVIELMR